MNLTDLFAMWEKMLADDKELASKETKFFAGFLSAISVEIL
jgi:hypothetical protein